MWSKAELDEMLECYHEVACISCGDIWESVCVDDDKALFIAIRESIERAYANGWMVPQARGSLMVICPMCKKANGAKPKPKQSTVTRKINFDLEEAE